MDFIEQAKALGLDADRLARGEVLKGEVQIQNLSHFRSLFAGDVSSEQRNNFSASLDANSEADPRTAPFTALAHHVFGNAPLSANHKAIEKDVFPVRVSVLVGENITISTDEVYGPAGGPAAILADTLTFDGGSVTATTTTLTIQANNLVVKPGGSKPYHVGILGQSGPAGTTPVPGPDGREGPAGKNASAPTPGICTGASNGGNGVNGDNGVDGGIGYTGDDGIANMPATITISAVESQIPLVVSTQSGAGGRGGTGSIGGAGGKGGKGGDGCSSGCEGTDGGNGGNGGNGGLGGTGGTGGIGANGRSIVITWPRTARSLLTTISNLAPPGQGGTGGSGGAAGAGGGGGRGGKHKSDGQAGTKGSDGSQGGTGLPGAQSGAAGNFDITYS